MGGCTSSPAAEYTAPGVGVAKEPSPTAWGDAPVAPGGVEVEEGLAFTAIPGAPVKKRRSRRHVKKQGGTPGRTPPAVTPERTVVEALAPVRARRAANAGSGVNLGAVGADRRSEAAVARLGLTGLANMGNTCFLNSAVQCLSHTLPLAEYFLDASFKRDLAKKNPLGSSKAGVASAFAKLVQQLWLGNAPVVQPTGFRKKIAGFAPRFAEDEQQDVQEFVSCLLDALHEDLNRAFRGSKDEDTNPEMLEDENPGAPAGLPAHVSAALQWQSHLDRNKSIVVDLFQGQLRSTVTCSSCGTCSSTFDPFMYLSVPLQSASGKRIRTLEAALQEFHRVERLTGDEQWKCPTCDALVDAVKQITIWRTPPVLVIHLKRFRHSSSGKRSKLNTKCAFPLTGLEVAGDGDVGEHHRYDLYAVTNHHGGAVGCGHYTAMAKNGLTSLWHAFNDSYVAHVPDDSVETKDAYLLFYAQVVPHTAPRPAKRASAAPAKARGHVRLAPLHGIPSPCKVKV